MPKAVLRGIPYFIICILKHRKLSKIKHNFSKNYYPPLCVFKLFRICREGRLQSSFMS